MEEPTRSDFVRGWRPRTAASIRTSISTVECVSFSDAATNVKKRGKIWIRGTNASFFIFLFFFFVSSWRCSIFRRIPWVLQVFCSIIWLAQAKRSFRCCGISRTPASPVPFLRRTVLGKLDYHYEHVVLSQAPETPIFLFAPVFFSLSHSLSFISVVLL